MKADKNLPVLNLTHLVTPPGGIHETPLGRYFKREKKKAKALGDKRRAKANRKRAKANRAKKCIR